MERVFTDCESDLDPNSVDEAHAMNDPHFSSGERPVKPCLHCDELVDAEASYCPYCSSLLLSVEGEGVREEGAGLDSGRSRPSFEEVLVGLVAGGAMAASIFALVWVIRW